MSIFGPVFWHDLVRVARRQRVTTWRIAYAGLLLVAVLILYVDQLPTVDLFHGGSVQNHEQMAGFANAFFAAFIAVQFAAVILFTPALAANAIAEERSRNTLMFLFTTHLSNREIIAGKLLTRLMQIGLLVLTGLPVLALMQFFGGIDPNLVLASFAAVMLTGISLGCLGLVCGIRVKKPQNAAWRAYQVLLVYAAISMLSIWYFQLPFGSSTGMVFTVAPGGFGSFAQVAKFSPPVNPEWWQTVIEAFNAGNPYFAYLRLYYEQAGNTPFAGALLIALREFAIFHGVIATLFGAYAFWRLRAVAAAQTAGLKPSKVKYLKPAPHPSIRDRPVLWKELYCESKPRQRWLSLFFSRWFFFVSFLPAWVIFLLVLDNSYGKLAEYTLIFLRLAGTLVACLMCIRVGLQAARSIGAERERETLDSLLTTALTPGEIIGGKWWGAFLNCRWILLWLLVHWGLGVLSQSIAWFSIPLLFIAVLIFAAFSVSVGMVCTAWSPNSKQAITLALLILVLGTTIVPWIGAKVLSIATGETRPNNGTWPPNYQRYSAPWPDQFAKAFSPPRALAECVVPSEYHHTRWYDSPEQFEPFAPFLALSLAMYLLAAVVLGFTAREIFRYKVRARFATARRLRQSDSAVVAELVSTPTAAT